jgi:diketogulonate reductase-like aldo/keto reductase
MQTVEAHGARIPILGLGTWELRGRSCVRLVEEAVRLGYRHFDTAQSYENEAEVGEGLRNSGLKRDAYFLTTKVWHTNFRAAELERSVDVSMAKLKLPYVDLLLLHWPNPAVPLKETVGALCKVKERGLARHIGVSNFTVKLVDEAVRLASAPIVNNQIELHPFVDAAKVIATCRRHGISITAYSPIARGRVQGERVLERIGKAHRKSAAQVSLRYLVQQDIIVIPRTSKPERLKENAAIFDFALAKPELDEIRALSRAGGRVVNVSWAPDWD